MKNEKYEITDIPHEKYPFLHRIRALQDFGDVKAGDLGGFVESESNLSFEGGDEAWIYDDAIACDRSYVDKHAQLRDKAVACNAAYVSKGARMCGESRAEDDSYLRGALLAENARISGNGMALDHPDLHTEPVIRGSASVYGKITGAFEIAGSALIFCSEELWNNSIDIFAINENSRTLLRSPERDDLSLNHRRSIASAKAPRPKAKGGGARG